MSVDILDLIGSTPMVELRSFGGRAKLMLKLEYMNPTGSHKDRIALYMIREAMEKGLVRKGGLVVEASSGNTGVSVAFVAGRLGLKCIIVVPRGTSREKVFMLKALGAEVVFGSDNPRDPDYYRRVAEEIAREKGGVFLNQYENKANVKAHYETTGPEIWRQTRGEITAFVMGVGTGGTITGVGRYLRERKSSVKIIGVLPAGSPLAGGVFGDRIEGLAYSDKPVLIDENLIDDYIEVSLREAAETCIKLARREGVLAGLSTGANVKAASIVAGEVDGVVVTIAADSILKYNEVLQEILRV